MKNNIRILLVEDEPNFGAVMKNYLEISDFDVVLCKNGKEGLESFENSKYDLCILDVMMPEMDGFTLAKRIKLINADIPLIFLTAKALKEDIIQGYRLGADDYITKPFDSELLIYKIKAILSRNNGISKASTIKQYSIGKFIFDPVLRTLTLNNQQEKLSPKESELLSLLCANMNQILPRENALRTIWGDDNFYTTRSMDVYITKLRKYLKPDSNLSIENIHGSGFRLLQINTPFDSTK
ncbi:response regulator [Labilibaculum sp. A4]|uniref:Response regulator n=1 Tax=Labilibaculum euxinus TaxID=2686357 RepID=A0A425Y602_9BACT|nr:response regulator transcription factor [Labilibaculum euxinus]MDQ1772249.1 response regulator transcription factor [Labilibaculum euxinus]MUP40066.1 response regulator [Labilibaculum euxinus]MVB09271.1 response regulator [Labilibaculum euxinus]MWN77951.1 response regulator [Labilibaculum euxinus]